MRNKFMKNLAIALCVGVSAVSALGGAQSLKTDGLNAGAENTYAFDEKNIALKFGSLSDPHVGYANNDQMLANALDVLDGFAGEGGVDLLYFHGDQTQDGTAAQVADFMEVINAHLDVTKVPTVITHGNHDTYWSGCMNTAQFAEAYGDDVYTFDVDEDMITTGNRHVEFNGYHFLSVQIRTYMPNVNDMSDQTQTWLKSTLDEIVAEDPDSYIFVSCHSPAKNTVYGSMNGDDEGPWGSSQQLDNILKDYPQVLLFSGHTHYTISDERSINQSTYTQINAGSVSDIVTNRTDTGLTTPYIANRRSYSQGMLVEVDDGGNVRVTRIDFKQNKQIKNYWYLDAPKADGSHLTRYNREAVLAANTAPYFAENAVVTVKETDATSLEISFPVAQDDDMVHDYKVSVLDSTGKTLRAVRELSPWYDYPDLTQLTEDRRYSFSGINTLKYPYTVEVIAYDSFGVASAAITKQMVDTTEQDKATAKTLDGQVSALAQKTQIEESDGEAIKALREAINGVSYKIVGFMEEYDTFVELEARYYNSFYLTADAANYEQSAANWYTLATSSKGSVTDSEYTGVKLAWNATAKNVSHGSNVAYNLDGLHISFANLSVDSENKTYAMLLSNKTKDKWLSDETFLLTVNFDTGAIGINGGTTTFNSELLRYTKLGATPFDFRFEIGDDGALVWKVKTVGGEETFKIPASELENLPNFTDTSSAYVSFCPWDSRTTGSVDVIAIHGGESVCEEYKEPTPPETPNGNGGKSGCGSSVSTASVIALAIGAGAVVGLKKKKEEKED